LRILDSKIVFVTGKGGVGKTTVAASIATRAALAGKRALIVESNGASRIPRLIGRNSRSYSPTYVAPNIQTLSITAKEAIEDYILLRIKVRALYKLVFQNRVMEPFLSAVPGLHDLVHLGKIYHLALEKNRDGSPRWDIIIFDAPATGHGLTMLDSPISMMNMTKAGPFYQAAKLVHDAFIDGTKTSVVLTSLCDELVVNETIELYKKLGQYRSQVAGVVLNETPSQPFDPISNWKAVRPSICSKSSEPIVSLMEAADRAVTKFEEKEKAKLRLVKEIPAPCAELPLLNSRNLSLVDFEDLSSHLGGV
jgi:anion-transporting  ArsA/GET3 family ATPase